MSRVVPPLPEQVRSDAELELTSRRARLVERLPVSVAEVDAGGVVVTANAVLAEVLGASLDRLVGLDLRSLRWHRSISADGAEVGFIPPIDRLLAGEPVDGLFAVTGLDGRRREVRVCAVPAEAGSSAALVVADVTAQLHRVQSQSAYADIYRTVAEHLVDVVVVTENEVITWVSPSVQWVLGFAPAEVLGRQIATLVHPEDRVDLRVSPDAPSMATLARVLRRDGTYRRIDGRIAAQFSPDGAVLRVLHVLRDVHDQHLADEKARNALLRKRAALDASPDGFAIYQVERDPVGRVSGLALEFLNAAGAAAYPGRAADLIGASILDFYPEAAGNGLWSDMITTLTTGEPRSRRIADQTPAGAVVIEVVTGRLDDDSIVVTYRDVTEQTHQQERLARSHHDLVQAQDTLRSALDAMADGFVICDAARGDHHELVDLQVVMCNRAAADRLGLNAEQVQETSLADILRDRPHGLMDHVVACLNDQQPRRDRHENGNFGEPGWGVHEVVLTAVGDDRLTIAIRDVTEDERARRAAEALRAQAEHQATHDPLTSLPNRALFMDRLTRALQECRVGDRVGIMYVDLDGFKQTNDTHGHAAGDAILCAVAERLSATVRPYDTAARLGGDEFAVILRHLPASLDTAPLIARTRQRLNRPVTGPTGPLEVQASIGLYLADPLTVEQDQEPATALHQADQAMYQAKHQDKQQDKHQHTSDQPTRRRGDDSPPATHPAAVEISSPAPTRQGHHHPDTELGPTCGPEDLARCRALAHHARPDRDLFTRPVCRRTGPLTNDTIGTLLEKIDALADQARRWSPEAWNLLSAAATETADLVTARKTARECAHYAGRDALLAYASSVLEAIATPAFIDKTDRDAALSLVHDALLAALAADLISDEISQALRHGLGSYWFI